MLYNRPYHRTDIYKTREQWLNAMSNELLKMFDPKYKMNEKKIRISCGFPKGGQGSRKIGQCWSTILSKDNTSEIFISPEIEEPTRVGDILLHELCHVAAGVANGHKSPFKRCALSVGLTGKMTATVASIPLYIKLLEIVYDLGKYPHARLTPISMKKEGTRLIKAYCPECGYTIRITQKWITEAGLPKCPNDCHDPTRLIQE